MSFKYALRRVFGRAPLEKQDLRLLHRIFQQMDHYVKRET
jgi:tRNA C32,U32 (ribose-2'-O)-methylase TrmJ